MALFLQHSAPAVGKMPICERGGRAGRGQRWESVFEWGGEGEREGGRGGGGPNVNAGTLVAAS